MGICNHHCLLRDFPMLHRCVCRFLSVAAISGGHDIITKTEDEGDVLLQATKSMSVSVEISGDIDSKFNIDSDEEMVRSEAVDDLHSFEDQNAVMAEAQPRWNGRKGRKGQKVEKWTKKRKGKKMEE